MKRYNNVIPIVNNVHNIKYNLNEIYCYEKDDKNIQCIFTGLFNCIFCKNSLCIHHSIKLSKNYKCCFNCFNNNETYYNIAMGIINNEIKNKAIVNSFMKCITKAFHGDKERFKIYPI